ncbi:two-component system repressor protein LuxO [Tepidamorphus gemmatus]|uniref:Two-component system repressor protein LuxO n=1 Tax=Tepidamorphus gemmatus TaxID=747076 RepID=A0A4R3M8X9_9HYPH|nr:sigma-54 dependent transcriptional regulator [Tepidamorphus gemmatus]TCT10004.1 two-component system repressor protein LuxO [Tepidamorphus gemmatus]
MVDRDGAFRRFVRAQANGHAGLDAEVVEAETWRDVRRHDASEAPDAILLAIDADGSGLPDIAEAAAVAPVIAVSAAGSLNLAVAAMRGGASDFLLKPVRWDNLRDAIARVRRRNVKARARKSAIAPDFDRFIGRSAVMRDVFELISRMAPSRAPVFITGESGTGKELTAEAIHARSGRTGAFVAINCAAIPRDLIESEIFGHVRGAFTGAQDDRAGAAELAHGGTLFLDEICEMDPGLQTKLLRFIQTGTIRRIGDTRTRHVDVRFVCATNRDPAREVEAGRFRADLYYRLNVLPVTLPPLRERSEDVLPLADAFLAMFSAEEGRAFTGYEPAARALLMSYDWPGNVRQLENVIRRVVVMNDGEKITAAMLALALATHGGHQARAGAHSAATAAATAHRPATIEPLWVQERRIIEAALEAFQGNVGQAAAALGISPSTIYRKKQSWPTAGAAA